MIAHLDRQEWSSLPAGLIVVYYRVFDDAGVHGSAHPSREEQLYAAVNTANTALCIRR